MESETRKLFEMLGANLQQKNVCSAKRGGTQATHAATEIEQQVAQLTKSVQQLCALRSDEEHQGRHDQCQLCGEHGHTALHCSYDVGEVDRSGFIPQQVH